MKICVRDADVKKIDHIMDKITFNHITSSSELTWILIFFQTNIFLFALVMALTAIPVGFSAGLFGIGGGLISVPVLFYIFGALGLSNDYIMHLAVGTSFAIIVPTSISSVLTHHKFKAVDFNIVKTYGLYAILGAILGNNICIHIKNRTVNFIFSIVTFFLGVYLIFLKEKKLNLNLNFKIYYKIFLVYFRFYFSSNGNRWCYYECASFKILWI